MGIRDKLNEKSGVAVGASIAVIVLAILFVTFQSHRRGGTRELKFATRYFYTTDDGTTLFSDDTSHIPPFEHDGREAVRAYVFSCDGGKHQWVQYIEKYTPEGRKVAEAFAQGTAKTGDNLFEGLMVKRPGGSAWVKKLGEGAANIVIPTCPDGMDKVTITEVYP